MTSGRCLIGADPQILLPKHLCFKNGSVTTAWEHIPGPPYTRTMVKLESHKPSRRRWRLRAVLLCLSSPVQVLLAGPSQTPLAIASLKIHPPVSGSGFSGTIAFLSDERIAALTCSGSIGKGTCRLVILALAGGSMQLSAEMISTNDGPTGRILRATSQGDILFAGLYGAYLISRNLKRTEKLPFHPWPSPQRGVNFAAAKHGDNWSIHRLTPPFDVARTGSGEIEAIGGDAIAVRRGLELRIETPEGRTLGLLPVKSRAKCASFVEFAGHGRIYLGDCGNNRIVEFSGATISRLHSPDQSKELRWSEDGSRVLFDYGTRKVPFLQSAGEILLALGTLGAGVSDQQDNGETIRVVDNASGRWCFNWEIHTLALGDPFEYHSDISPSGKFIAVIGPEGVSLYKLAESCANMSR